MRRNDRKSRPAHGRCVAMAPPMSALRGLADAADLSVHGLVKPGHVIFFDECVGLLNGYLLRLRLFDDHAPELAVI
jgi:hypothetical protein